MEKVGPQSAEARDSLDGAKGDEKETRGHESVQLSGFLKKHSTSMDERVQELLQREESLSDLVARSQPHEKRLNFIGYYGGGSAFMDGDVDTSTDTDLDREEIIRPSLSLRGDGGPVRVLNLGTERRAATCAGTDVPRTDARDEFIRDLVAEQVLFGTWRVLGGRLNAHFGTQRPEQEVYDRWDRVMKAKANSTEERARGEAQLGSKSPQGPPMADASPCTSEDALSPPPQRDQDSMNLLDGMGAAANQAHALPENHWTANRDAFLRGMVAYGGRQDWEGKTAVLNQFFTESFTKEQVFMRCKELDERATSSTSSSGTPAPRKVSAPSSSSSPGILWTTEEDEILLAEGRRAHRDWRKVATLLPGRSAKALQCRFRRIRSQASPEPSTSKPEGTTAVAAKASKLPSSLAQQSKGRKQKETGDRNAFARPPRPRTGRGTKRNVENFGTEESQQAKIPAMVSSTGRTFTHSLFLRTMPPPPPPQQQQQQQQGTADKK